MAFALKNILGITLLINLGVATYAFGVLGLLFSIALFVGMYLVLGSVFRLKKGIPEKAGFASVHLMGVIAVNSIFGNPLLTVMVLVLEGGVFFIFGSGMTD